MIDLPPPPRFNNYPGLGDWLFKLWRLVMSLVPRQSRGTITTHTVNGVLREARPPEAAEGDGTGPVWL